MNIRKLCLVLEVLLGVTFAACNTVISRNGVEMSYNITKSYFCQTDEHMIRHLFDISLPDCVMECGLRQHCLALSYRRGMQWCLLLRSLETHDIENTTCDYIQRMHIVINNVPCLCKDGAACDLKSLTCKVKECSYPVPIRASVTGNTRSVGSNIQYICHYGTADDTRITRATCLQDGTWSYIANCTYIRDCADYYNQGYRTSGVYTLQLTSGKRFNVSCDMSIDSGGWVIIQRRISDSDFYKSWMEYKNGFFGDLNGNFWIGNEKIWQLTQNGSWKLRIDLTCCGHESGYAEYKAFAVGNEKSKYVLTAVGYTGNIGNSLDMHNGQPFTTRDRDNDLNENNCAHTFKGGWWYKDCHEVNLNGLYESELYGRGMVWFKWKRHYTSMTTTLMKIQKVG